MQALYKALHKNPIVFVARDLERAFGLAGAPRFHIITNATPFAKTAASNLPNIHLIVNKSLLSTLDLLGHKTTQSILVKLKQPKILVFKNTTQIEKICRAHNWTLLNPPAELANQVEEKISQIKWLGPLTKYLPPHKIVLGKGLSWPLVIPAKAGIRTVGSPIRSGMTSKKFIAQFNRAHTGSGTALIKSKKQTREIANQFPNRPIRVTKYISGPAFTVNAVVWGPPTGEASKNVLTGNISYQITGLPPFTSSQFATIGNDWKLPNKLLTTKQTNQIKKIATAVGKKLAKHNWRGLFGIDVMLETKTGKIYLIEINARQPASTTYESQLQQLVISTEPAGRANDKLITTFEAHLAAVLGLPYKNQKIIPIKNGSQIIMRVPENVGSRSPKATWILPRQKALVKKLEPNKFNVVYYNNTKPGEDWLRIQARAGIMQTPGVFSALGKIITKIIKAQ
ncbi:MAG: ATP-grasp domain-containing protein [Candidatus Magasanikbacteria bacterium]|nr:ATP-grasp domain-containing protein [Candidatus Magasanikbacteria bacterium]